MRFHSCSERLVGDAAKNQAAMNPHGTVFDAKVSELNTPTFRTSS